MKYYYGIICKKLDDGTYHTSEIRFLIRRFRNSPGKWFYKVKIGYSEPLESMSNKPIEFISDLDWNDAIKYVFNREFRFPAVALEFLTDVVF